MWKTVVIPTSRGKSRHGKRNKSKVQNTKRVPAKKDVIAEMGWDDKTTFSPRDIQLYEAACYFKIYMKSLIRELIYHSDRSYLVKEASFHNYVGWFVEALLEKLMKKEKTVPRQYRYALNKDNPEDGLKHLRASFTDRYWLDYWQDIYEDVQDVIEKYNTEICPVCLEPFISPGQHETQMKTLCQQNTRDTDFIRTLSCGHHIHNTCLCAMYNSLPGLYDLVSCPLCRHVDLTMSYNRTSLKMHHEDKYQDCLNELSLQFHPKYHMMPGDLP